MVTEDEFRALWPQDYGHMKERLQLLITKVREDARDYLRPRFSGKTWSHNLGGEGIPRPLKERADALVEQASDAYFWEKDAAKAEALLVEASALFGSETEAVDGT